MKNDISENIKQALAELRDYHTKQLDLGMKLFKLENRSLYMMDFFTSAAINRSMAQCSGFISLIENRNLICASSILRLQIDTLIRTYASYLVENPHEFAQKVFKGEQINKIKDRSGELMNDAYLVKRLSEHHPWLKNVYKETSGYVHFSKKHIFSVISSEGLDENGHLNANIKIGPEDQDTPDEIYIEAIQAFTHVTSIFIESIQGWLDLKSRS